jgi:hypothetical protein
MHSRANPLKEENKATNPTLLVRDQVPRRETARRRLGRWRAGLRQR